MTIPETYPAFVAERDGDQVRRGVRQLGPDDLPEGEVTVRVRYSSVNYKDALATLAKGGVARISPLVPGIDLAGEVAESSVPELRPGDQVLAHGQELGAARHGGFSHWARVPAAWVVPLPDGLSAREAMALGTAGFTAGLSVHELERRGLAPGDGPILVTGASGGVGSSAIGILAARGYEVVASTGKAETHPWLRRLGASEVLDRSETSAPSRKPLESARWAGAVDCVGGATLAYILRTLRYGAGAAASGLTGGTALETTVLPFILRGVALLGIDSAACPQPLRAEIWRRLGGDLRPTTLLDDPDWISEIGLDDLDGVLDEILAGRARGRWVVALD